MGTKDYQKACRKIIPEGMVLLENKNNSLPLSKNDKVALFGRGQFEYVKSGTGSGGRVNCPYIRQIADELAKRVVLDEKVKRFYQKFILENPFSNGDNWVCNISQKNPYLDEEFVKDSSIRNNKAILIISRSCGEGYDFINDKGAYQLTDNEERSIKLISKYYKHFIILINSGNLIDMSFIKKYNVPTVVYIWQGGQEGALGTVDALMGDCPISGHLSDTIAKNINQYPSTRNFLNEVANIHEEDIFVGYRYFETFAKEDVLYPFGYGLSYTSFDINLLEVKHEHNQIKIKIKVKNTGFFDGKEVVQIYYGVLNGRLSHPAKVLIAFKKTRLLKKDDEEILSFEIKESSLVSYDDIELHSYILDKGIYELYYGTNVRNTKKAIDFFVKNEKIITKCHQALTPKYQFNRMIVGENGKIAYEPAPYINQFPYNTIKKVKAFTKFDSKGTLYTLKDVANKKLTLKDLVSTLNLKELMCLIKGEGMSSQKAYISGTASCFGGLTKDLNDKGIAILTTCDGPSGLRMENHTVATCIPCGTLLASTFNPKIMKKMYYEFANEMKNNRVDVILGPGINIHRNPLGGRNFEYFSEDPYLTGVMAGTIANYFKENDVACTIKHFACNSQELKRSGENEILSERCAREIYLKPFEIAVKMGGVNAIMTAYNRINGISCSANYDLTTTILRKEWKYKGIVMTDWWAKIDDLWKNTFNIENIANMIKAQNDIYMVVPDTTYYNSNLQEYYDKGILSLGELQRSVYNILSFVLNSYSFKNGYGKLQSFDENELTFINEFDIIENPIEIYEKTARSHIYLQNKLEGLYFVEFDYKIDGDPLIQHSINIAVEDLWTSVMLVLNGTEGQIKTAKFKFYGKKNARISFIGEAQVLKLRLYKVR